MAKAKTKAKTANTKKKNIKEVEIEEVIEDIEEFDDEEFDFVDEDEVEEVETVPKKKVSKVVEDDDDEDVVELTMEERIISIEKKQNVILVFVVISALLSLFAFVSGLGDNHTYSDETDDTEVTDTTTSYDTSAFTKVKAQDLESLSKKDTIIVWIGRQGCGYCSQFVPTITSIGEKLNETIYYLDLSDVFDFSTSPVQVVDDEAYDLLLNFDTDAENAEIMNEFGATPMTLVIKKNKIVGGFVGAYDETTLLDNLEDEGFKQK